MGIFDDALSKSHAWADRRTLNILHLTAGVQHMDSRLGASSAVVCASHAVQCLACVGTYVGTNLPESVATWRRHVGQFAVGTGQFKLRKCSEGTACSRTHVALWY